MDRKAIFREQMRRLGIDPDSRDERALQWEQERARYEKEQQQRHLHRMRMERNIQLFFETPGLYRYDPEGKITSAELYSLYKQWCIKEHLPLKPPREFWLYAKRNASSYRLVYSTHIPEDSGKRVRGFYGIRPLTKEEIQSPPSAALDDK